MKRHKEPTSWEHCCSCVPILEKEIKELKEQFKSKLKKGVTDECR
tara:strand:- start:143 stop:277 length:135 start_codon:yes stop_codon:yes gene_type:complete